VALRRPHIYTLIKERKKKKTKHKKKLLLLFVPLSLVLFFASFFFLGRKSLVSSGLSSRQLSGSKRKVPKERIYIHTGYSDLILMTLLPSAMNNWTNRKKRNMVFGYYLSK
jgi:hypothetical protein